MPLSALKLYMLRKNNSPKHIHTQAGERERERERDLQHLNILNALLLPIAAIRTARSTPPDGHIARIVHSRAWDLTSQLLQSLPLGLGHQQGGEDTTEHEERVDLHDVVEPRGGVGGGGSLGTERADEDLGNDGADFAGGGGETVGGGTVTGRETFTGGDEGGGVGAEVEEELGENVESEEALRAEVVVGEANDDEENGKHGETHKLDGPAANGVDSGDSDPVARNCASADNDDVSDSCPVEKFINVATAGISNSS